VETSKPAKEFIQDALRETGLNLSELAEKLAYPSLKRASYGEIPLPESKRRHILDIVALHRAHQVATKFGDEGGGVSYPGTSPRETLRAALTARGMNIAQLAKRTKYGAGVLDGVVNGTGRMSEDMARAIHRELPEIEVEDLLAGSDSPRVMDQTGLTGTHGATPTIQLPGGGKTRFAPLLSWAAAGKLATVDALDDGYAHDGIVSNVPGRAFAVEVRGDSMQPDIKEGDHVVVRADVEPRAGQIVLVRTIHGDVLCKRFQTKDGGKMIVLSSVNQSYLPYEIPASEIAWIYPVKQVIRNY
jgi:SOS-response transcriptional repressor LexA